jgi:hypothetical protein
MAKIALLSAALVVLLLGEQAAAQRRTVELRILEYYAENAESARLNEIVGSLDPRDIASRGMPQYSGEKADALVSQLDKSFKPTRHFQVELPLDAGRPSRFKFRSGNDFAEGSLSISENRDGSTAMSLTLQMATQTGRIQTTIQLGDGTVGKPFATALGGLQTSGKSGGKRTQETQLAIAIARVVATDSK